MLHINYTLLTLLYYGVIMWGRREGGGGDGGKEKWGFSFISWERKRGRE